MKKVKVLILTALFTFGPLCALWAYLCTLAPKAVKSLVSATGMETTTMKWFLAIHMVVLITAGTVLLGMLLIRYREVFAKWTLCLISATLLLAIYATLVLAGLGILVYLSEWTGIESLILGLIFMGATITGAAKVAIEATRRFFHKFKQEINEVL